MTISHKKSLGSASGRPFCSIVLHPVCFLSHFESNSFTLLYNLESGGKKPFDFVNFSISVNQYRHGIENSPKISGFDLNSVGFRSFFHIFGVIIAKEFLDSLIGVGEDIYTFMAEDPGIRMTESGKWGVQIHHPIEKNMKCVGTYNTIEEAKNVYEKNKLETEMQLEIIEPKDSGVQRANPDCKGFKGVRRIRSGRWSAEIKTPLTQKGVYLGTFDSPEEAADAYTKKRREFDEILIAFGKKQKCSSTELKKNASSSDTKNAEHKKKCVKVQDSETSCVRYKGVRKTRPGRWSAEIKDPFKRKGVYLGTFNSPEEAADAYAKKRREFDDALAEKRREFEDALMALGKKQECKDEPSKNVSFSNSTLTEGNNSNNEDNRIMMHEDVDVGVINNYGQLIGEYSMIDDDLWLTGL